MRDSNRISFKIKHFSELLVLPQSQVESLKAPFFMQLGDIL